MTKTELCALALALTLGGCAKAGSDNASAAPSNMVEARADSATSTLASVPLIISSGGKSHRLDVEVAQTPQQQEQGLMFRKTLAPDKGMVFPMNPPRTASFWMKNTVIPLDMLFVRTDGSIALVAANAKPYDLTPVSAGIPVSGVIELPGGRAAQLGIKAGDKVQWGDCATSGPPSGAEKPATGADVNFCP